MEIKKLVDNLYEELYDLITPYYKTPYSIKKRIELIDAIQRTLIGYVNSLEIVNCSVVRTSYSKVRGSRDFFVRGDAPQPDNKIHAKKDIIGIPSSDINIYFEMPFFAQIMCRKNTTYGKRTFVPSKRAMKLQISVLISVFMHELQHIKQYTRLTRKEYNQLKIFAKVDKADEYGYKADLVKPVDNYITEHNDDEKYRNYILDEFELESFAIQSVVEQYLYPYKKLTIPDHFIYSTTAPEKVYDIYNKFKCKFGAKFGLSYKNA